MAGEIGRGRADSRGEWVILPDGLLGPGARELSLVMRLPGAAPIEGEGRVLLLVPEPATTRPDHRPPWRSSYVAGRRPVATLQAPVATRLTLDLVDYGPDGDAPLRRRRPARGRAASST
jgi:hypothetical protein